MASGVFNEGAFALGDGAIVFDTDAAIKIMLVKSGYTFNKDHSVTDLAAQEVGVSGYTGGFNGAALFFGDTHRVQLLSGAPIDATVGVDVGGRRNGRRCGRDPREHERRRLLGAVLHRPHGHADQRWHALDRV